MRGKLILTKSQPNASHSAIHCTIMYTLYSDRERGGKRISLLLLCLPSHSAIQVRAHARTPRNAIKMNAKRVIKHVRTSRIRQHRHEHARKSFAFSSASSSTRFFCATCSGRAVALARVFRAHCTTIRVWQAEDGGGARPHVSAALALAAAHTTESAVA